MIPKRLTVDIGSRLKIGDGCPIAVQTMCNTHTQDVEASLSQCRAMYEAGAALIRLTTQGMREVEALDRIKSQLHADGIFTPLVADVHFNADVALAAAFVADKVRINPGNFAPRHEDACAKFRQLINICRNEGTAIRIGLNHGSLGERITTLYGNTPTAMKEAVMEWLRMCVDENFLNVVVSLKASNTKVMVEAYRLLHKAMGDEFGMIFPTHLGVTEAGNGDQGRIKSAVGMATLLKEGIGDTIRVSLTENPVNEIGAGEAIVRHAAAPHKKDISGAPAEGQGNGFSSERASNNASNNAANNASNNASENTSENASENASEKTLEAVIEAEDWNDFIIKASCIAGPSLLDCTADRCDFSGSTVGGATVPEERLAGFHDMLLQACRRKFTSPEYIACPGCGRTLYDLETTFNEVKRRTAHLAGVKIAIMGCIVNGPGEMADADFGYVGEGEGHVTLYKGRQPVMRRVPQNEAIDRLIDLIEGR